MSRQALHDLYFGQLVDKLKRKKLVAMASVIAASVLLGYLFFVSWLFTFVMCKWTSGKSSGERGRVPSIVIPLGRWTVHVHHWLCCLCVVGISVATDLHFLTATVTYGLLGGAIFQGIYCYNDWHRILVRGNTIKMEEAVTVTSQ